MRKPKFITSHQYRLKRAKDLIDRLGEKVSIFDREAFVEFFLLEDIARLYEYRLDRETQKAVETGEGAKTRDLNIEKFTAILNLFNSAIEITWGQITSENYSAVWRAVPERALMKAANKAANSVKDLPVLKKIGVDLLRKLCDDQLPDYDPFGRGNSHLEEIEAIIKAVEVAIPDKNAAAHARPNIN